LHLRGMHAGRHTAQRCGRYSAQPAERGSLVCPGTLEFDVTRISGISRMCRRLATPKTLLYARTTRLLPLPIALHSTLELFERSLVLFLLTIRRDSALLPLHALNLLVSTLYTIP
jgi:hypothetical protein